MCPSNPANVQLLSNRQKTARQAVLIWASQRLIRKDWAPHQGYIQTQFQLEAASQEGGRKSQFSRTGPQKLMNKWMSLFLLFQVQHMN